MSDSRNRSFPGFRIFGNGLRFAITASIAAGIMVFWERPYSDAVAGDSLRCHGRLVEIGDTTEEVRSICGEPEDIRREKLHPDSWISKYDYDSYGNPRLPYLIKGPVNLERWTYDFGSNRLPYYLDFENGRLIHFETGIRRRHPIAH